MFTFDEMIISYFNKSLQSWLWIFYYKFSDNRNLYVFICSISCIKHLQKQDTPTGAELADDEFILHVEGTASSQRVVRHIGGTSWPGKCTIFVSFAIELRPVFCSHIYR